MNGITQQRLALLVLLVGLLLSGCRIIPSDFEANVQFTSVLGKSELLDQFERADYRYTDQGEIKYLIFDLETSHAIGEIEGMTRIKFFTWENNKPRMELNYFSWLYFKGSMVPPGDMRKVPYQIVLPLRIEDGKVFAFAQKSRNFDLGSVDYCLSDSGEGIAVYIRSTDMVRVHKELIKVLSYEEISKYLGLK